MCRTVVRRGSDGEILKQRASKQLAVTNRFGSSVRRAESGWAILGLEVFLSQGLPFGHFATNESHGRLSTCPSHFCCWLANVLPTVDQRRPRSLAASALSQPNLPSFDQRLARVKLDPGNFICAPALRISPQKWQLEQWGSWQTQPHSKRLDLHHAASLFPIISWPWRPRALALPSRRLQAHAMLSISVSQSYQTSP